MSGAVRVTRVEVDCGACGGTFGMPPGASCCPLCAHVTVVACAEGEVALTPVAQVEALKAACAEAATAGAKVAGDRLKARASAPEPQGEESGT